MDASTDFEVPAGNEQFPCSKEQADTKGICEQMFSTSQYSDTVANMKLSCKHGLVQCPNFENKCSKSQENLPTMLKAMT